MHSLLVLFVLAVPALAQGTPLLVVAPTSGPDVDHTSLQAAVDAAPEGATILVRPGSYAPPVVTAKSLTIVGDAALAPVVLGFGGAEVRDLSTGQVVVLRGFTWQVSPGAGLALISNAGRVWIEDCALGGGDSGASLAVGASASVTCRSCTFPFTISGSLSPVSGIESTASTLRLYGCTSWGGSFQSDFGGCAPTSGVFLGGSELFAQDCAFFGGDCCCEAFAAPAAWVRFDSHAILRNCTLLPGTGTGYVAPDLGITDTSTATTVASVERSLELESPLRVGVPAIATILGAPNELALVFVSTVPGDALLPAYASVVAVDAPATFVALAPLDATGHGSLPVVATLAPGIETSTVFAQAIHLSTEVGSGAPTAVTVIPATL